MNDLSSVNWLQIGATDDYAALKQAIGHVCRDVANAGCIDELCINDIVVTFLKHGYVIVPKEGSS